MADFLTAPAQWPRSLNVLGVGVSFLLAFASNYDESPILTLYLSQNLGVYGLNETTQSLIFSISFFFIAYVIGEVLMEIGSRVIRRDGRHEKRAAMSHFASMDKSGFWTMKLIDADRRSELFSGLAGFSLLFLLGSAPNALAGGRFGDAAALCLGGILGFVLSRAAAIASFREFVETLEAIERASPEGKK